MVVSETYLELENGQMVGGILSFELENDPIILGILRL